MTTIISAPNCTLKFTQNQVKITRQNPAPHQLQVRQIWREIQILLQVKTRLLQIKKLAMCRWKKNRTKWPKTKRKHWKDFEKRISKIILKTNINIFYVRIIISLIYFLAQMHTRFDFFLKIAFLSSFLFKWASRFCSYEKLRKIG